MIFLFKGDLIMYIGFENKFYNLDAAYRFQPSSFMENGSNNAGGMVITLYYPDEEKELDIAVLKNDERLKEMKVNKHGELLDFTETFVDVFTNFTGVYLTRAMEKNVGLLNLNIAQEAMDMAAYDLMASSEGNEINYADLLAAVGHHFFDCANAHLQYDEFTQAIDSLLY